MINERIGLIGYTGFVGSNIARQAKPGKLYNSKNINEIIGREFDVLYCAGARAEKWRINQDPETDIKEINSLIEHLKQVKTKKLVLISTIDVYNNTAGVDEDTIIDVDSLHPYGLHRMMLEEFCRDNFNCTVIRLPGLFGDGLKKNVIYDLLHNNNVEKIEHAGVFQYYNLSNLVKDINVTVDNKLELINFATEPIRTDELARAALGIEDFNNHIDGVQPGNYDIHSKFAQIFSSQNFYMYTKTQILEDIKDFIVNEKLRLS